MEASFTIPLFLSILTLSLLAIIFVLFQSKKKQEELLKQQKSELAHLDQQFSMLLERHQELKEFRSNMAEAEIATRLHTSRLMSKPVSGQHLSEKYRCILTLSEKGMTHSEIASSLSVSLQEVKQILSLSSLTRSQSLERLLHD